MKVATVYIVTLYRVRPEGRVRACGVALALRYMLKAIAFVLV